MIDIVKLKMADYLKFDVKGQYIYCTNTDTKESVIVGITREEEKADSLCVRSKVTGYSYLVRKTKGKNRCNLQYLINNYPSSGRLEWWPADRFVVEE